jgi:hypothetical protein
MLWTAIPPSRTTSGYVAAYGLGWKAEDHDRVTLPGFSGTADLDCARRLRSGW